MRFNSVKKALGLFLTIILLTTVVPNQIPPIAGQVSVKLQRSPQDTHSMQPVLVYAYYSGTFNTIRLKVTADINTSVNPIGVISIPKPPVRTVEITMVPAGWGAGWYVAGIPGLPSQTVTAQVAKITVTSRVSYKLLVDGVEKDSDSYTVTEEAVEKKIPPLVSASVYGVVDDSSIISETLGLGPKGWTWSSKSDMKTLILATDNKGLAGLAKLTFEYSVGGGSWKELPVSDDPIMVTVRDFVSTLSSDLEGVENDVRLKVKDFDLPDPVPSLMIASATVSAQPAGSYVKFRANATDVDGNQVSSPMGLYYTVNKSSAVKKILIVDPHVWLWLYRENVIQLLDTVKSNSDYQVPTDLTGVLKIAQVVKDYGVEPFHHWEYLGGTYDLYIAYPKSTLTDQLNSRWDVIILSNLWLGYLSAGDKSWDWDLKDLGVFDKVADYVRANHTGLVATHGTLGDWKIWKGCGEPQKVGSRGHTGEAVSDLNVVKETTVAGLLGVPHLALWEFARDKAAQALCTEAPPVGMAVGSTPLQVPFVPFNGTMQVTDDSKNLGWNIPPEFTIATRSIYRDSGVQSYTQVGWQLAMPSGLAYISWLKANDQSPLANKLYQKLSNLVMNITSLNVRQSLNDSLKGGLNSLYNSIIQSNITGTRLDATVRLPDLNRSTRLTVDIGRNLDQLLQLLPVKLIAVSNDRLAGIMTNDKYWHRDGYRSVYFSFEPEASEGSIAKTLLLEAVNWSMKWEYKDITSLLGGKLRLANDKISKFNEELGKQTGKEIFSGGLLLNEKGEASIALNVSGPSRLSIFVAHPTSAKIVFNMSGPVETVDIREPVERISSLTLTTSGGPVFLKLQADPDSSINPIYISAATITMQANTTTSTTSTTTTTTTTMTKTTTPTTTTSVTTIVMTTSTATSTSAATGTASSQTTTATSPNGIGMTGIYVGLVIVIIVIVAAVIATRRTGSRKERI